MPKASSKQSTPAKKPTPGKKPLDAPLTAQQQKDAEYAQLGERFRSDEDIPQPLRNLSNDPRVTVRRGGAPDPRGKCIVYWMQRAQRGRDNHALDKAVDVANALGLPLVAYFAGISNFPHANLRHYVFLNQGLPDITEDCAARNIGFVTRYAPHEDHMRFFAEVQAAMVLGDENAMRVPEQWRVDIAGKLRIPFWTVDADVIVPSKLLLKAQYSGAIARPRLMRALPGFLKPIGNPHAAKPWKQPKGLHADDPHADMTHGWKHLDRSVGAVDAWHGGSHEASRRLELFVRDKLAKYADDRNHPEREASSRLSPYLHYGHIGPLTIALTIEAAVKKNPKLAPARDSYFNEVITWRELSVNFCRYQPEYDNPGCVDRWAAETIARHDRDKRDTLYTLAQLESAQTYDELWNAAQSQMVRFGWMPNYLRMLWGKKIVEWTPDVKTAMEWLIYLNDKYFLDGRDPNGYSGIAWTALGKFDRPWQERPIFGKRRYMSSGSAMRKFDAKSYIADANESPR